MPKTIVCKEGVVVGTNNSGGDHSNYQDATNSNADDFGHDYREEINGNGFVLINEIDGFPNTHQI